MAILLSVLVPAAAVASTSYSGGKLHGTAVQISCTTGSETGTPPTTDPETTSQGLALYGMSGFTVYAEAASAFTAGGFLAAYLWLAPSSKWVRAPDLDLYVDSALAEQGWAGFQVVSSTGGIVYLPSGVGVAVDIHIIATKAR
ncbi:MAG: hypothetical protein P1V51_22405 [Deltaproteobacteria bacterium]|nr:hypothetical protein [Deltaproteobacteria bacterium]